MIHLGVGKFLNKSVKVVYSDGQRVSVKHGVLQEDDGKFLIVDSRETGLIKISWSRVVRLELTSNGKN